MLFHNLLASVLYRVVTYTLIVTMTSTSSIPLIRYLPKATAAYLGMLQQLGLVEQDPTSLAGVRPLAPKGMEGMTMPTIGPDGEPVGILLNADALQMNEEDFAPPALANPLSVSRAQSAYATTDAISGTLVITFTITNNRPPAILPDIPVSATITETISATLAIDFFNDPNVIRNVLLADTLSDSGAFISSSPMPDRRPATGEMAWNLGDIPPLGSITATLFISVPASVSTFTELDTGASAWGTLEGRAVSASSAPAMLAPDSIGGEPSGDWLIWTVDADYYDEYMVAKAAELGNDWQQLFAYVRSLGYESYKGSLRGTRGTLWSEAGNSLDQASLLIAMLRGSGVPARYRHGTLNTARAQELILSMFPKPQGTIGHIPPGTEVADPANDPQLLAETIDHWWVEAYLPGLGWTNLDPCFANAAPGQTFYSTLAADGTDRIAEAPDSTRHKVTLSVKVENYHQLNMGNSGLAYAYPLTWTFNSVELVGNPVTLGYLVNTDVRGGMIFYAVQHTYVPYFAVGDSETVIEGHAFQDLFSNFPAGNFVHTGMWLHLDTYNADGELVDHFEREVADRIGAENRIAGGNVSVSFEGNPTPLVSPIDTFTTIVAPGLVPEEPARQMLPQAIQLAQGAETLTQEIDENDLAERLEQIDYMRQALAASQKVTGLQHLNISDVFAQATAQSLMVRTYPDTPRAVIVSMHLDESGMSSALDLIANNVRVLANPGQAQAAPAQYRFLRGLRESALEGVITQQATGLPAASAAHIIAAAGEQNIPLVSIDQSNLDTLQTLTISETARSRITQAVQQGKAVLVPERAVQINGQLHLGWFEIAPDGTTEGILENGTRGAYTFAPLSQPIVDYGITVSSVSFILALAVPAILFIMGFIFGVIYTLLLLVAAGECNTDVVGAALTLVAAIAAIFATIPGFQSFVLGFGLGSALVIFAYYLAYRPSHCKQKDDNGNDDKPPSPEDDDNVDCSIVNAHTVKLGETLAKIASTCCPGDQFEYRYSLWSINTCPSWEHNNPDFQYCVGAIYFDSNGQPTRFGDDLHVDYLLLLPNPDNFNCDISRQCGSNGQLKAQQPQFHLHNSLDKATTDLDGINYSTLAQEQGTVSLSAADQFPLLPQLYQLDARASNSESDAVVYNGAYTFANGQLVADSSPSHALMKGDLTTSWQKTSETRLNYKALSVVSATVHLPDGSILGSGKVEAWSRGDDPIALSGSDLVYEINGWASLADYSPALAGLGLATNWRNYRLIASATSFDPVTIHPDALYFNNTLYVSETYTLELNSSIIFRGNGPTLTPMFAEQLQAEMTGARIRLAPGSGTATLGAHALDASQGIVAAGFSGAITITEQTTATDRIQMTGTISQIVELGVAPPTQAVIPFQNAYFQVDVLSNLTDTYYLEVSGPPGWGIDLDESGAVTVTPGVNLAQPGDYTFLVVAQSYSRPELIVSARHTVTIASHQGMAMDVAQDPLITVPWGPSQGGAGGGFDTNNGQLQLTDAAYTVDITNTSTTSHTFSISISGLPSGWLVLSGAECAGAGACAPTTTLTLPAGGIGQVGLYVSPTVTSLPPPNTPHPFSVTATAVDNPSLTQNDSDVFTVPAIAFNHLTAAPALVYSAPGFTATFDISIKNVGNISGAFPLSLTLPITTWISSPLVSPLNLEPSQSITQAVTLSTTTGEIGRAYPLRIHSPSGGAYTQTTYIQAQLVSSGTLQVYQAAQQAAQLYPDDVTLPAALEYLGLAIGEVQADCQDGNLMEEILRDRLALGAQAVANHLAAYPLVTADDTLRQIADVIETHATCAELAPDVSALQDAISDLTAQLTAIARHDARVAFQPGAAVVLVDRPAAYTLSVQNRGELTTTYAITFYPESWGLSPITCTLAPDISISSSISIPLSITPTALGEFYLQANIVAQEAPIVHAQASAGLRSLDAFLDVSRVGANPPFVEYASGTPAQLYAHISNLANAPLAGQARTQVWDVNGMPILTDTRAIQFVSTLAPLRYDLVTLDTSGLVTGVYTITLEALDAGNVIIPRGAGWGRFVVGQAVEATQEVVPSIVPPGNVTVTTFITTELSEAYMGAPLGKTVYHAGSLGIAVTNLSPGPSPTRRGEFPPSLVGKGARGLGQTALFVPPSREIPESHHAQAGTGKPAYALVWPPFGPERPLALPAQAVTPTTDFSADPIAGSAPLEVSFIDLSSPTLEIDTWLWDFGDVETSTLQDPTHVYSYSGFYTVSLTTWSGVYSDTETRPSYIQVGALSPQSISEFGANSVEQPALAYNADDEESLVVWQQFDGSQWDIVGRRVNSGGSPVGDPIQIVTDTATQRDPAVAYAPNAGYYLVIWVDERNTPNDIYGQLVSYEGELIDSNFVIGDGDPSGDGAGGPDVVFNPDSYEFLVVWYDKEISDTATDIFAQRVSAYGMLIDGRQAVVQEWAWTLNPSVAASSSGAYLLAWMDNPNAFDIAARTMSADLSDLDPVFTVYSSSFADVDPNVAYNSLADAFLVVWDSWGSGRPRKTMERWVLPSGQTSGDPFTLDIPASVQTDEERPTARYDPATEQMLVMWADNRAGDSNVYGQLVGAAGPLNRAQLLVAGADVQTKPALSEGNLAVWRNGSAQSIQGANLSPLWADFAADVQQGMVPQTVQFSGSVTPPGVAERWLWNFGDGATGQGQTATHTYVLPGLYTVKLNVMGDHQQAIETKPDYIWVTLVPTQNVTITTNTTWSDQKLTLGTLVVTNSAILTLTGNTIITAENIIVAQGAAISANGQGYGAASGPGQGASGTDPWNPSGGGGGHGGHGGQGSDGAAGGGEYGDLYYPQTNGSGGGNTPNAYGGSGGGTIRLVVSQTLAVSGTISADGNPGAEWMGDEVGGGGAGGSIWLTAGAFAGDGTVRANGAGDYFYPYAVMAGSGGGGRIAIYADDYSFNGAVQADGGGWGGGVHAGQPGTIYLGQVDPVSSTVAVLPPTGVITAGGTPAIITVTLVTTAGAPVEGESVGLEIIEGQGCYINGYFANPDTVVWIGTTDAQGAVAATLSSTYAGARTIRAWVRDDPQRYRLLQTASITVAPGLPHPSRSFIEASPTSLYVNGSSSIIVTVRDAYYNNVPGQEVSLLLINGVNVTVTQPLSPTNAVGKAWGSILTTRAQAVTMGALAVTAGVTLTRRVTVTFQPGPVSLVTSSLAVTPTEVFADGQSVATATVTLLDNYDNPVSGKTVAIHTTGTAITITPPSGTTDTAGRFVATILSQIVQTVTVTALDVTDGLTLPQAIELAFIAGSTHRYFSTVEASPGPFVADGLDSATIIVTLKNASHEPVADHAVSLVASGSNNFILGPFPALSGPDGVVTFTLATLQAATKTVTATDTTDDITLAAHPQVLFAAGPPDPIASSAQANPANVAADGVAASTITVMVRDAYHNPVPNVTVTLTDTGAGTLLTQPANPTGADGGTWGTIRSTVVEDVSVTALVGGTPLASTTVHFLGMDLAMSKYGPASVAAGQSITFALRVENVGLMSAPAVLLTDTLPLSITFAAQYSSYPFTRTGQTLVWSLGDMGAGDHRFVRLVGTVTTTALLGEQLVNQATARAADWEANLANNSDSATATVVPPYGFSSQIIPISQTVGLGGPAAFQVSVRNSGVLADAYTFALTGLETMTTTLSPASLWLLAGKTGETTLTVVEDDCAAAGVYPFTVTITSTGSSQSQTLPGELTLTNLPLITDLSPTDGITVGARSVLFTWQTSSSGTTQLYLRPAGGSFTGYDGEAGVLHQVIVGDLQRYTTYEWYAETVNACGAAEQSSVRSFYVDSGIVFSAPAFDFTVERDYAQQAYIAVTNQDDIAHTLVMTVENPSDELIVGFVGYGSVDYPILLSPGETRNVELVIHAQDTQSTEYNLTARLFADEGTNDPIQDAAAVNVHIHMPYFNLALQETSYDPVTLVRGFQVTNTGDALTDLNLTANSTGDGSLYLWPGVGHGYLAPGQMLAFEAFPVIDAGFQALTATLTAAAAGHSATQMVTLTLPPGKQVFNGQVENVMMQVRRKDWYCTNRPSIYTPLTLPSGFHSANANSAQLLISFKPHSGVRPHSVAVYLNGHLVGLLLNMIPHGSYAFDIDPTFLNEAIAGPSDNLVWLETTHLNGGHYVVTTDMTLVACMDEVNDWVVASSQAEADQLVAQRSYLLPAPTTLEVDILQPNPGQVVTVGGEIQVTAQISDDIGRQASHLVMLESSNGNGSLILHDDGQHNDGDARDGTFGNTWTPVNAGTTVLTVTSSCCAIVGADYTTVEVVNLDLLVDVSHHIPLTGTSPLTSAATPPPLRILPGVGELLAEWQHLLRPSQPRQVVALPVALPAMQPGQVRQIASSTVVSYTGPGGSGQIKLGPLYVTASRLVAISPTSQLAGLGSQVVYQVSLLNPSSDTNTYTVTVAGLPSGWTEPLPAISLAGGEQTHLPLTVTVPADGEPGPYTFAVGVENSLGGHDQAQAQLEVTAAQAQVSVWPKWSAAGNGEVTSYTIAVTNTGLVNRIFALSTEGLAGNGVALPSTIEVGAGQGVTVSLVITAGVERGPHAFSVNANYAAGSQTIGASDDGVLYVLTDLRVTGALSPTIAIGGQASPALYTLAVTNTGSLSDTCDITLTVPVSWTYELSANGQPQSHLSLTPYVFNSARLQLLVIPADGAPEGDYIITATITSRTDPAVQANISGLTHVSHHGVTLNITPHSTTMDPPGTKTWEVAVTNTGEQADVFDLMAGGIVSSTAQFDINPVSLAANQSTVVHLSASNLNVALPQTCPFGVTARSQGEPAVWGYDTAEVTFTGFEDIAAGITPTLVTLTDTFTAHYLLLITNTGNVDTIYTLHMSSEPAGPGLELETDEVYIPPHMTGGILLTARAGAEGTYTLTLSADSVSGPAQDSATATLVVNPGSLACQPDPHEEDDLPTLVSGLAMGAPATFNFCDDASDWITFTAQANEVYTITTHAWGQRADTLLALYDTDAATLLALNDDYAGATDFSSRIAWQAPAAGTYFVRVSNRGQLTGNQTGYDLQVDTTAGPSDLLLYLPLVLRNAMPSAAAPWQPNIILSPLGVITHTLPDAYELDDTWQQAQPILPGQAQTHTFDSPTAGFAPDKDYVQFAVPIYSEVTFTVLSRVGATPTLELYGPTGDPYIEAGHWITGSLALAWQAPSAQTYFLAAVDAGAAIPATYTLQLQVKPAGRLYLPIVLREL